MTVSGLDRGEWLVRRESLDRLMGTHDVAPVCPLCFGEAKAVVQAY